MPPIPSPPPWYRTTGQEVLECIDRTRDGNLTIADARAGECIELQYLALIVLIVPLCCFCCVCFCCLLPKSKYPGHEKEFRQYHMSHSNPYVVPGYMPAERRKQLKQQYKSGRIEAPTLSGGQKDSGTPRTTDEKTDVGKV